MNNISRIQNCYGCGVCAMACNKNIIDVQLNEEGFYVPYIADVKKCTKCGICLAVCSYHHGDLAQKEPTFTSYAAWSKDATNRQNCSSGGVSFEVGRHLIENGYKVCGVRYNVNLNRAEHYIASTIDELIQSIGSKYIQSYTLDCFKQINRREKHLVIGTPCQIDSFRRYIQKFHCEENFVLMDFFCHGVPSKLMWDKYIQWAEQQVGKPTYVSWRNKRIGWHDSYNILIKGKKKNLNSCLSQGDMFYRLFLSDSCLGKACYDKCRFKLSCSSADIRVGDAWGNLYKEDAEGVSIVITFTEKGEKIIKASNCVLKNHPFESISEGQMKNPPIRTELYYLVSKKLRNPRLSIVDIFEAYENYLKLKRWKNLFFNPLQSIMTFIRKKNRHED